MSVPALELGDACLVPCVLLCRVRKMWPCLLVSSHLQWKGLVSQEWAGSGISFQNLG